MPKYTSAPASALQARSLSAKERSLLSAVFITESGLRRDDFGKIRSLLTRLGVRQAGNMADTEVRIMVDTACSLVAASRPRVVPQQSQRQQQPSGHPMKRTSGGEVNATAAVAGGADPLSASSASPARRLTAEVQQKQLKSGGKATPPRGAKSSAGASASASPRTQRSASRSPNSSSRRGRRGRGVSPDRAAGADEEAGASAADAPPPLTPEQLQEKAKEAAAAAAAAEAAAEEAALREHEALLGPPNRMLTLQEFIIFVDLLKQNFVAAVSAADADVLEAYISVGGQEDTGGDVSADMLRGRFKDINLAVDIDKLIEAVDEDGSGKIEYGEFLSLMTNSVMSACVVPRGSALLRAPQGEERVTKSEAAAREQRVAAAAASVTPPAAAVPVASVTPPPPPPPAEASEGAIADESAIAEGHAVAAEQPKTSEGEEGTAPPLGVTPAAAPPSHRRVTIVDGPLFNAASSQNNNAAAAAVSLASAAAQSSGNTSIAMGSDEDEEEAAERRRLRRIEQQKAEAAAPEILDPFCLFRRLGGDPDDEEARRIPKAQILAALPDVGLNSDELRNYLYFVSQSYRDHFTLEAFEEEVVSRVDLGHRAARSSDSEDDDDEEGGGGGREGGVGAYRGGRKRRATSVGGMAGLSLLLAGVKGIGGAAVRTRSGVANANNPPVSSAASSHGEGGHRNSHTQQHHSNGGDHHTNGDGHSGDAVGSGDADSSGSGVDRGALASALAAFEGCFSSLSPTLFLTSSGGGGAGGDGDSSGDGGAATHYFIRKGCTLPPAVLHCLGLNVSHLTWFVNFFKRRRAAGATSPNADRCLRAVDALLQILFAHRGGCAACYADVARAQRGPTVTERLLAARTGTGKHGGGAESKKKGQGRGESAPGPYTHAALAASPHSPFTVIVPSMTQSSPWRAGTSGINCRNKQQDTFLVGKIAVPVVPARRGDAAAVESSGSDTEGPQLGDVGNSANDTDDEVRQGEKGSRSHSNSQASDDEGGGQSAARSHARATGAAVVAADGGGGASPQPHSPRPPRGARPRDGPAADDAHNASNCNSLPPLASPSSSPRKGAGAGARGASASPLISTTTALVVPSSPRRAGTAGTTKGSSPTATASVELAIAPHIASRYPDVVPDASLAGINVPALSGERDPRLAGVAPRFMPTPDCNAIALRVLRKAANMGGAAKAEHHSYNGSSGVLPSAAAAVAGSPNHSSGAANNSSAPHFVASPPRGGTAPASSRHSQPSAARDTSHAFGRSDQQHRLSLFPPASPPRHTAAHQANSGGSEARWAMGSHSARSPRQQQRHSSSQQWSGGAETARSYGKDRANASKDSPYSVSAVHGAADPPRGSVSSTATAQWAKQSYQSAAPPSVSPAVAAARRLREQRMAAMASAAGDSVSTAEGTNGGIVALPPI